ncbi:MAG TPA: CHAD domain-containing protein, partial [Ktedonobacteraceae bacterium]|nr:CHAD domain-containing protein [Ktedonobacteraceae bacterium]
MQQQASSIYAAIDIGSNTIEVLIARCSPYYLEKLEQQTTMVRLGENVDEKGEIARDKFKMALRVIRQYQKLAKNRGAKEILAIATEALREARNSQTFIEAVKRETGIEVQLISGYAEATLDFFGATYSTSDLSDVGVLDVGGGSTEIVIAKDTSISWLTSVPFGSGTIQDRYLPSDPPTRVEMEAARSYLAGQLQMMHIQKSPGTLIVTGSSASSLLKLAGTAFKLDEQNDRLAFEDLSLCEGLLCALPSKEIAKRYEQRIERARVLPAGGLIIQAVMQYLQLKEIHVSSHGVREGALLAYARYGQAWLEEVNSIASKWGTSPWDQDNTQMQAAQQQSFAEFGREILPKYAKKFVKWPDDVREQEDIEAVHKMRVASRRLRAALDAFESCVDPESFKQIDTRVKKLADALGTVRDTDVMISGLSNYMQEIASEEQAGVQWLIDRL